MSSNYNVSPPDEGTTAPLTVDAQAELASRDYVRLKQLAAGAEKLLKGSPQNIDSLSQTTTTITPTPLSALFDIRSKTPDISAPPHTANTTDYFRDSPMPTVDREKIEKMIASNSALTPDQKSAIIGNMLNNLDEIQRTFDDIQRYKIELYQG